MIFMPAYKDEKTGKWFAKFYYTNWQGIKKQKWKRGFATKKEALGFERDFLEKQYEAIRCSDSAVVQYFITDGSGEERKEKENEK